MADTPTTSNVCASQRGTLLAQTMLTVNNFFQVKPATFN